MTDSLHLCFISQEYPPDTGWGGIGSYTFEMAHALVEAGHRVTVIARAADEERIVDDRGVEVHRIQPAPRWDRMPVLWRMNRVWPGFAWAAMRRLREIHRRSPVDVVESGECRADGFFVSWLRQPRPRSITRLHLAWIFVDRNNSIAPDLKKRLTYWLEKQSILRADAVTAPSAAVVRITREWLGHSLPASVVPNPIDIRGFAPDSNVRAREVLFVGRLERGKGIAILSKALPLVLDRCPDVTARIIGSDGEDENGRSWRARILEELRPEQRDRVRFEHLSRTDLMQRYRNTAICVVPSVWENFPYTVLEAMASGTPVVATDAGGLPELIEDGRTGLLTLAGDPASLANALCELLDDPQRSQAMGREARRRAEETFSTTAIVGRMVDFYRELCRT